MLLERPVATTSVVPVRSSIPIKMVVFAPITFALSSTTLDVFFGTSKARPVNVTLSGVPSVMADLVVPICTPSTYSCRLFRSPVRASPSPSSAVASSPSNDIDVTRTSPEVPAVKTALEITA